MAVADKTPGADVPVGNPELMVTEAITRMRIEAEDAKTERLRQNRLNRDVFFGRQDWAHKQEGQSTEFLPKVPIAVEQMAAFVKRGLIQFGDWFSVDVNREIAHIVTGGHIRSIMKCFLNDLWARNNVIQKLPIVISDSVKMGMLESLMILKVHGGMMPTRKFNFERGAGQQDHRLQMEDTKEWRLRIDLVRPEDYYPDPTGNGMYEIHRVERDLHEVLEAAEDGMYDMAAVRTMIDTSYPRPMDEERTDRDRNQPETTDPSFRKKVILDEFWGTLLNSDGTIAHRNCVATVANDNILIRKPEPNPFWHQESPFVVAPLVRVPFSVWHKALYDHASALNTSLNELFNLILDGGISSVWGIKQLRLEDLEDPGQVAGGVKQGMTLAVKQTLPHNAKVLETVATGEVPNDAMAVFEALNREFAQAALTNELKLGQMPPKRLLATEIVEASQSQAVTLDGIISDVEVCVMQEVLRKAWLTILQNMDMIPEHALTSVTDRQIALLLQRASPEERFALFAGRSQFRVFGLSATMARALDFQKLMSLQQAIMQNPMLFQAFMMKFSPDKTLRHIMRTLNVNPDDIEKDIEEQAEVARQQEMARTQQAAQMLGPQGQGGASAPGAGAGGAPLGGGSEVPAQINQGTNPMTGLAPNK